MSSKPHSVSTVDLTWLKVLLFIRASFNINHSVNLAQIDEGFCCQKDRYKPNSHQVKVHVALAGETEFLRKVIQTIKRQDMAEAPARLTFYKAAGITAAELHIELSLITQFNESLFCQAGL